MDVYVVIAGYAHGSTEYMSVWSSLKLAKNEVKSCEETKTVHFDWYDIEQMTIDEC